MAFKKFTQVNQRFEDRITVTPTSAFGFPAKFFKDQQLDQYKYAVLYFDQEIMAVGLNFTNSEEEHHKFSLLKSKQGYGGQITARSFFRSYNLDPKKYSGKYEWAIDESDPVVGKLYVIILKEKVSINKPEIVASENSNVESTVMPNIQEEDNPQPIPQQPSQQEATNPLPIPPSPNLEVNTNDDNGGVS
jgi:hypothetical protein